MEYLNKVLQGDALETLKGLPDECVQMCVTSPPYNIGKDYENAVSVEEYAAYYRPLLKEVWRVLKPTGSICWQVGNFVKAGQIYPLEYLFHPMLAELGAQLRNRIIWTFEHGLHCTKRFSGRHEVISWYTKSDEYIFNLDTVRVPQLHPNKRHFKGERKGELSSNPLGKNPSDVWRIGNVKHNHPEKTEHPCQFPEQLVGRCVLAFSNEEDIVLDPFAGSGTTGAVCKKHNRNYILIEREPRYIAIAEERIGRISDSLFSQAQAA